MTARKCVLLFTSALWSVCAWRLRSDKLYPTAANTAEKITDVWKFSVTLKTGLNVKTYTFKGHNSDL